MHIWMSLQLLFPNHVEHLNLNFDEDHMNILFKIGIVELSSTTNSPKFVHRTFAEYFIARFILEELKDGESCGEEISNFLFEEVMECKQRNVLVLDENYIISWTFVRYTMVYFLNCFMSPSTNKVISPTLINPVSICKISHACANDMFVQIFKAFVANKIGLIKPSDMDNLLLIAVQNSSTEFVKLIFQQIQTLNKLGLKLLRVAIQRGEYSIYDFLAKFGSLSIIIKDMIGNAKYLLHDCIKNSKYLADRLIAEKKQILQSLIKTNELLLEQRDELGRAPLLCEHVHIDLLIHLINQGASVVSRDHDGDTVLHMSYQNLSRRFTSKEYHLLVTSISSEMLWRLLQTRGKFSDTPLLRLILFADPLPETFELFKKAGMDINCKNNHEEPALIVAICNGRNLETIRKLIELGADLKWRGNKGQTLIHLAAWRGEVEIVGLLVQEVGLDVNALDEKGSTPLDYCILSDKDKSSGKRVAVGMLLQKFGATTATTYAQQNLAEEEALLANFLEKGNIDSVKLLQHLKYNTNHVKLVQRPSFTSSVEKDMDETDFQLLVSKFVESRGRLNDYIDLDGNSLLHLAVNRCDEQAVKDIVEVGGNVSSKNNNMETPLHRVYYINDVDIALKIANILIENSSDVSAVNKRNQTFLHNLVNRDPCLTPQEFQTLVEFLAKKGLLKLLEIPGWTDNSTPLHQALRNIEVEKETLLLLSKNEVDLNLVDSKNWSVLTYALYGNRSINIIRLLVRLGANAKHFGNQRLSFLHLSSEWGHVDAVNYFLEEIKLDVNGINEFGNTPLHRLVQFGQKNILEIAWLLIKGGADLNFVNIAGNDTPLTVARRIGRNSKLVWLLENGEDLKINSAPLIDLLSSEERRLNLHKAVEGIRNKDNCIEIIKSLIEDGADVFSRNDMGETFLHSLLESSLIPSPSQFHKLVVYLASKNYSKLFDIPGGVDVQTPLQIAVRWIKVEERTLLLLYSEGVNFNSVDKHGQSLLSYVVRGGHPSSLLNCIAKLGGNLNLASAENESLLHTAIEFGNKDALDYLLRSKKFDINLQNDFLYTPLHYVLLAKGTSGNCDLDFAQLLLEAGANINAKDVDEWTPLHHVFYQKRSEILKCVKFLHTAGADLFAKDEINLTFLHLLLQVETIVRHGPTQECVWKKPFLKNVAYSLYELDELHDVESQRSPNEFPDKWLRVNYFLGEVAKTEPLTAFQFNEIVEFLVETGNSELLCIPGDANLSLPLHLTVFNLEVETKTLELFTSAGANFNARDKNGNSVLAYAVEGKRSGEFLIRLICAGASWKDLDSEKNSLLHRIAEQGEVELLDELINSKLEFDFNCMNAKGETPLHKVIQSGEKRVLDVIHWLTKHGANVNCRNDALWTPLHFAAMRKNRSDIVDIFQLLIDNGADGFAKSSDDLTFLHMLFDEKEWERESFWTPLEFHKLTELLIKNHLSELFHLPQGTDRVTHLHLVAQRIDVQQNTLELLYSAQVNFAVKDGNGNTILSYASDGGRSPEFISSLIRYGTEKQIQQLN